jgi:hypothetical protein
MENKKTARTIFIVLGVLVLLIIILIVLGLPKNLGPIEPFLNFCDLFKKGDGKTPGKPAYYQKISDCSIGEAATAGELIQPDVGCDGWEINRYERPFNATSQDEYYPDLDIQYIFLGRDADWYYLRFALFDPQPGAEFLPGTYAVEMDLDLDGRGDLLVLVSEPGKEAGKKWSAQGVQIWADSNNDVGGLQPNVPENEVAADGYDTLLFNQGIGDNPDSAWARAFLTGSAYVELAFKGDYLGGDMSFKWWGWAWHGGYSPGIFELHDFYSHEQAGDTNEGMEFFPIKEVFAIDSTCAKMWGANPKPDDPEICPIEDEYHKCCLLNLFRCRIPFDIPGDDPCVLPFEEWFISIWVPTHPGQPTPPGGQLWEEYGTYLLDPFCPPANLVTPTPTLTSGPTPTFTLESTATFTPTLTEPAPTDTPTPTDTTTPTATKYVPPPPQCTKNYSKKKCLEAGGTWVDGGLDAFGRPLPDYCQCP